MEEINDEQVKERVPDGMHPSIFCFLATILFSPVTPAQAPAEVPVVKITPEDSSIKFGVKASVSIDL